MQRPKITQREIANLVASKYKIDEPVFVVAIRGYYKDSMGKVGENDRNLYDDCIVLVGPNYYKTFNGNTDPSKYKESIATLIPGLHFFKMGKHGISKPGGGYDAFRPDTPDESLPVFRDGKEGIHKGIAINLHKGGYSTTSSEGCQTIHPDQWLEFQRDAYKIMQLEGQRRLPYALFEQSELPD